MDNSSARYRLDGFLSEARRLGLATDERWVHLGQYSVEWGREATERLLSSGDMPDAIVAADDLIAIGSLDACHSAGVRVPEDVRITGFDNTMFSAMTSPPLTTIDQPCDQIAAEVLRLLDETVVGDSSRLPASISLMPTLIVRKSS